MILNNRRPSDSWDWRREYLHIYLFLKYHSINYLSSKEKVKFT